MTEIHILSAARTAIGGFGGSLYTCYSMEAASWVGGGAQHMNLQVSGWEFSEITSLTNGVKSGYVW